MNIRYWCCMQPFNGFWWGMEFVGETVSLNKCRH
ncbi:hypothetical protein [Microbulbifer spongiae]